MSVGLISPASFAAAGFSLFLCAGLPALVLAALLLKRRVSIKPVLVGAGVFILFQLVLRISVFIPMVGSIPALSGMLSNLWSYSIFLGLTAGLFEELGRVAGYGLLLKGSRTWWDGFAFGLGHGGIEAISITGMAMVNNLILMATLNRTGSLESLAGGQPEALETLRTVQEQLLGASPVDFLLGGVERVFAMTVQIALSLLVLYALRRRQYLYVALAVLLHTLIDAPLGILPSFGWNVYAIEGYLACCALAGLAYILLSRRSFAALEQIDPRPQPPAGE